MTFCGASLSTHREDKIGTDGIPGSYLIKLRGFIKLARPFKNSQSDFYSEQFKFDSSAVGKVKIDAANDIRQETYLMLLRRKRDKNHNENGETCHYEISGPGSS